MLPRKYLLIVVTLALANTPILMIQQIQVTSIIGRVGDGYEAGKEQGKEDFRNRNGWNDNCPPNVGVQYCIGWVAGYNVGYGSLNIADN